jgi:hypothetical protein
VAMCAQRSPHYGLLSKVASRRLKAYLYNIL